jgi:predicted NBD/HSP70 family sugar kinase
MTPQREVLNGFAVDLGGTKIAAARIVAGRIAARAQIATDPGASGDAQVDAMRDLLEGLTYRRGDALGIAVSGRIDAEGRWHAVNTHTLTGVSATPISEWTAERIGPCYCLNDAAAAVLAEAHYGAGQGAESLVYVTVSTGVGGGFVLGGGLLSSASGLAGHVGFAGSRLSDRLCGSGRAGTVESIASGGAIAAAAAEAGYRMDAREVLAAARGGAVWADAIVDRSARAIAALIADLTAILGLDRAVLGGSIGLSTGYLERVATALSGEPELFQVPLYPAGLGPDAPLYGALARACQEHTG